MKRLWMAGIAAAAVIAGSGAMAQDDEAASGTTTTTTWTVKPEERTVIHDYVVKEKIRPEAVSEDIAVGAPVPADVELQPVPAEIYGRVPEARRYEYFDWNGRVVFVNPDSRKVVQIVN